MNVPSSRDMRRLLSQAWVPPAFLLIEVAWFVWFFMTEKDVGSGRPLRLILMDDAMISMDYARSLVQGCGLVWYCGADKVEGFTNPLWVFYMAFWHLFPISPNLIALPIILTGVATLFIQMHYVKKIAQLYFSERVGSLAQWVMVLLQPAWIWHIGGLETGALMALTVFLAYRALRKEKVDALMLFLIAVGLLIRMDFLVLAVPIGAYVSWQRKELYPLGKVLLLAVGVLGGLAWARWSYYEALVPNTYQLKVSSIPFLLRLANGFFSLAGNVLLLHLPLWAFAIKGAIRHRTSGLFTLWLALVLATSFYNVYVGGDAWDTQELSNRHLASTYPLSALWVAGEILPLRTLFRVGILLLVANGLTLRLPYFLLLHPHAHSLSQQTVSNHYSVFVPFDLKALMVSRESTVWLGPAGTTPYFFPGYKYRDYFGKCDSSVARSSPTCYAPARFYQLYAPGHSRVGIDKVLLDEKAEVVFIGRKGRIGRSYTICCEAQQYISALAERFDYDERGFWRRKRDE